MVKILIQNQVCNESEVFLVLLTHVASWDLTEDLLLNTRIQHFTVCMPSHHAIPMTTA